MSATAGCGCQYDAAGNVFVDRCVCPDTEMARVRAGHGLDTPTRPGGLLGAEMRRRRAALAEHTPEEGT